MSQIDLQEEPRNERTSRGDERDEDAVETQICVAEITRRTTGSMNASSFGEIIRACRNRLFVQAFASTQGVQEQIMSILPPPSELEQSDDEVAVLATDVITVTPPEWFREKEKLVFYRQPVESGREYIVATHSTSRSWRLGKVVAIIHNVRLQENRCVVLLSGLKSGRDNVPLSEIAYEDECASLIPVGTSVVTNVLNRSSTRFDVGVIIEAPGPTNRYRYLVCFESGSYSYTNHNDLRVTCQQYTCRMSRFDRYLIRDIMSTPADRRRYDRILLRFKTGEKTVANLKGNWVEGVVKDKDCSLVAIEFTEGEPEWVYRGSYRFLKILKEQVVPYGTRGSLRKLQKSLCQLAIESRDSQSPPKDLVLVDGARQLLAGPTRVNSTCPTTLITPLFVYGYYPKDRGMHRCDPECVASEHLINRIDPRYSPLVKPLCVGFRRPRSPMEGTYIAPCGRILRNFEDLNMFFADTRIAFTSENFDFSCSIDVQRIHKPLNVLASKPDISLGREKCPISCVNEVNNRLPDEITYETERSFAHEPLERMNTNGDFVSCCSCEDDCSDPTKCECRSLTLNSYLEIDDATLNYSDVGYSNKRLRHEIRSGIYECNSRCPCTSKCPNRLAQFPIRAHLQVFYTGKKGWGVRALHDLPAGTFVCVYVGKLMTEKEANAWGSLHGDEYFADLDFIKIQESRKPGFEEEAISDPEPDPEPSCSLPDPSRPKRRATQDAPCPAKRAKRKRTKAAFPPKSLRWLYPPDNAEYVMDAKTRGNVGRFFNHSCEPNLFVQNVFVDTHDLRFPWVAFFAKEDIPAGQELTWDYNYDVGSVRGKRLYCYCLSPFCKRRLY